MSENTENLIKEKIDGLELIISQKGTEISKVERRQEKYI